MQKLWLLFCGRFSAIGAWRRFPLGVGAILNGIVIPRRTKRVAKNTNPSGWKKAPHSRFHGAPGGGCAAAFVCHEQRANKKQPRRDLERSSRVKVRYAMAYGAPAVSEVLAEEQQAGVEQFVVLPLIPSTRDDHRCGLRSNCPLYTRSARYPRHQVIKHYYDQPDYIQALAASVRAH